MDTLFVCEGFTSSVKDVDDSSDISSTSPSMPRVFWWKSMHSITLSLELCIGESASSSTFYCYIKYIWRKWNSCNSIGNCVISQCAAKTNDANVCGLRGILGMESSLCLCWSGSSGVWSQCRMRRWWSCMGALTTFLSTKTVASMARWAGVSFLFYYWIGILYWIMIQETHSS